MQEEMSSQNQFDHGPCPMKDIPLVEENANTCPNQAFSVDITIELQEHMASQMNLFVRK